MEAKAKVEVFGLRTQPAGGGCSCSGGCGDGCGPVQTMGEMYEDMVQFIGQSDVKDKVETKFIDIFEEDINKYGNIKQVMDRGFQPPIVALNGKAIFAGGVENEAIYAAIKKTL